MRGIDGWIADLAEAEAKDMTDLARMVREHAEERAIGRLFEAIAWAALVTRERKEHGDEIRDIRREMRDAINDARIEALERAERN